MTTTTLDFAHPYPLALERFPTIRQSLLSTFDNCALTSYFDAEYRRGWSTPWQARGQLFHRFAAEALRTMAAMREDEIPVDAALSILRDVLRQSEADRHCPACNTDKIKSGVDLKTGERECADGHRFESQMVNVPIAMVKDLYWTTIKWAHESSFAIRDLVDVEQRLKATIRYPHPQGGYVPRELTGALDALFVEGSDHAIVLDWKDTWGLPAAHEAGVDDDVSFFGYFQQRFYAWLVMSNYPSVERVTLREFYVRYSQPREATVSREVLPEIESELAALTERFDRMWNEHLELAPSRRSRRTPFRPTPGKHCGWCIRPGACPIPDFARLDGRIVGEKEAEEFARQVIVAEALLKSGRKALRAYADIHGPVPVRDAKGKRVLGYQVSERVERPSLEDLERAERSAGRPLTSNEVRKLYRKKTVAKFGAHTPQDVDEAAGDAELQRQLEASLEAAREAQDRLVAEPPPDNVVPIRPAEGEAAPQSAPPPSPSA